MAINITRWTPDTCVAPGCVIEFSWDDATPDIQSPANVVSRCTAHAALATPAALWTVLRDENPRKNRLLNWVLANTSFTLKDISWQFDAQRVLTITVIGLTAGQQTVAQNWADTNLGVGKVIVVRG